MASAAASEPVAGADNSEPAKLDIFKDALYEACQGAGSDSHLFTQSDLVELGTIPRSDPMLLLRVVQALCDERLLVAVSTREGLAWKWRDAGEAQKYKLCTSDEQAMVYSIIDDAGSDGIWSRNISNRIKMNDSVMRSVLRQLVAKQLIAQFNSVEYPNKKMYIKASIRPSERATGGPWYTDQTFDDAFIEEVQRVIFDLIKKESTYRSAPGARRGGGRTPTAAGAAAAAERTLQPKKGTITGGPPQGKKRPADDMSDDTGASPSSATAATAAGPGGGNANAGNADGGKNTATIMPFPAGYRNYPTVRDIARRLTATGITNNTILSEAEVQMLVDLLVWDGLVEQITVSGRRGYRVTRIPRQSLERWSGGRAEEGSAIAERGMPEPYVSGLTEVPCGRCPVFDLCEEGGPVSPSNCVYFDKWLGTD